MNTPTPTPRTDMATYPADCLGTTLVTNRDCSRALERELVALTAERDHWQKIAVSASREREHNANVAQAMTAERDQLRAEVERLSALGSWAHTCIHHTDEERKAWAACPCCAIARADRAEAEAERYRLVTLKQDAKIATAKERLRSEAMDDYASIKDLQRELAAERGKLDWVFQNCKVEANDYSTGNRDVYYVHDREDLGVAMKEDAK